MGMRKKIEKLVAEGYAVEFEPNYDGDIKVTLSILQTGEKGKLDYAYYFGYAETVEEALARALEDEKRCLEAEKSSFVIEKETDKTN